MKIFNIRERSVTIAWQRILEDPQRLTISFNRMLFVVLGKYTKGWSITAFCIAKRVCFLHKKGGFKFCSAYLKACSVTLMNYLSWDDTLGPRLTSIQGTKCSITRCGLPRLIASKHRSIIRKGGKEANEIVRCYLTLFGFYRMYYRKSGRADLSSICEAGPIRSLGEYNILRIKPPVVEGIAEPLDDVLHFLEKVFPSFAMKLIPNFPTDLLMGFDWRPSWSSGPNVKDTPSRTSVQVLRRDLGHWYHEMTKPSTEQEKALQELLLRLVCDQFFPARLVHIPVPPIFHGKSATFTNLLVQCSKPKAGRWGILGKKIEGGGKIRVFAMLDSVRQACLRPVHNWLMRALRTIPNDGTYNQVKPMNALRDRELPNLWSYDLKSATDRFPLFLQSALMGGFFGTLIKAGWEMMMMFPFDVPFVKAKGISYQFAMGQPLGAYSSWPAFSLTHHAFIQYCAQKAGAPKNAWFTKYALLGDDIIIAHKRVAQVYREMLDYMGVVVSLHKSIVSNNRSCEFAKRFLWKGVDVSPVSFKEVYCIRRSTCNSLVKRILRFRSVSRVETYRWFGAGYRVLPSHLLPKQGRWKRFNLMLTAPGGPFALPFYWWCSLYAVRPVTRSDSAIVHSEILEKWSFKFEPEGIPSDKDEDIVDEVFIGRPWISSWLSTNTSFLLSLMADDPILGWFHRPTVPSTPERPLVDRSFRLGKMYWIYDRLMAIVKRPSRKLLSV